MAGALGGVSERQAGSRGWRLLEFRSRLMESSIAPAAHAARRHRGDAPQNGADPSREIFKLHVRSCASGGGHPAGHQQVAVRVAVRSLGAMWGYRSGYGGGGGARGGFGSQASDNWRYLTVSLTAAGGSLPSMRGWGCCRTIWSISSRPI